MHSETCKIRPANFADRNAVLQQSMWSMASHRKKKKKKKKKKTVTMEYGFQYFEIERDITVPCWTDTKTTPSTTGSRAKDRLERKDVIRRDNTFLNENKGSDHRFDQNLSIREHNQCCYKIVNRCKKNGAAGKVRDNLDMDWRSRHAEWKKWRNFNAGVILTDEEVRQLTEEGFEIFPMQWIEVDKVAHLRRDSDCASVRAKYKSRLVGFGNFETKEGLRTDSPAFDTILFAVGVHKLMFPFTRAISRTDTVRQEIERILLYRVPAEGTPEEGIAGGSI